MLKNNNPNKSSIAILAGRKHFLHSHPGKQGQVAIEYLTSYGWIFIIIFLALSVITFMGVINPNNYIPEECHIHGNLECKDKYLSTDGNLSLLIRNSYPVNINITGAESDTGRDLDCNWTIIPRGGTGRFTCYMHKEYGDGQGNQINMVLKFRRHGSYTTGEYRSDASIFVKTGEKDVTNINCTSLGGEVCNYPMQYCNSPYSAENPYVFGPPVYNYTEEGTDYYSICCLDIAGGCQVMPTCANGINDDNDNCIDFEGGDRDCNAGKYVADEDDEEGCQGCPIGSSCQPEEECEYPTSPIFGQVPFHCDTEGYICCDD